MPLSRLAPKASALTTRPSLPYRVSARGLVVMIVACQVMDPGSIPGERRIFFENFFLSQRKKGVMRESNSRPLAPKARIIPLDQSPMPSLGDWSSGMILASGASASSILASPLLGVFLFSFCDQKGVMRESNSRPLAP